MQEDTRQRDNQDITDPDHPIGDPPEGSSGGQSGSGDPRPVPGSDDQ